MNIFGLTITSEWAIKHRDAKIELLYERVAERDELIEKLENPDVVYYDDCEFDFDELDVFSIEREAHHTGIAWYTLEGEMETWYFKCSLKRHKELVKEFKESKE